MHFIYIYTTILAMKSGKHFLITYWSCQLVINLKRSKGWKMCWLAVNKWREWKRWLMIQVQWLVF